MIFFSSTCLYFVYGKNGENRIRLSWFQSYIRLMDLTEMHIFLNYLKR